MEELCQRYMKKLCVEISERSVGSQGNRDATSFFLEKMKSLGWMTRCQEFNAIDWKDGGASLTAEGQHFEVKVSPYSLGCDVAGELIGISCVEELQISETENKILFLHDEMVKEQLMPKNFVFYNPDSHKKKVSLLERSGAKAIISATGRNAALAGGMYPFPLIEDGDFNIPSVYMTDREGEKLLPHLGKSFRLESKSRRISGKGYNVIGRRGKDTGKRIVVTAHIDSKKGTPGAIDNATGVTVLLLLAGLLKNYNGDKMIELVAMNGEDYYSVPGQMVYVDENRNRFEDILLNINIDGAGYQDGMSVFSLYNLPLEYKQRVLDIFQQYGGIKEGIQWSQGDHSIFIQYGCPAIAVSSEWFTENIESQDITHTPQDNITIVNYEKVVEISSALSDFLQK